MKLDARFESDFKDNYKELKVAFERLKILKVCSVAYVAMQSPDSHMRALKPISAQALSVAKAFNFTLCRLAVPGQAAAHVLPNSACISYLLVVHLLQRYVLLRAERLCPAFAVCTKKLELPLSLLMPETFVPCVPCSGSA